MSDVTLIIDGAPIPVFLGENTALAAQSAASASSEADRAEQAVLDAKDVVAAAEALVGPSYATTGAGLAATPSGQYFAVTAGGITSIYLNNAGSAVLQRTLASSASLAVSDGAGLVGFDYGQTYSSGTIGDAVSHQRITVKDNPYLALGNGMDDDTAKLNAAMATGKAIRIPPGNYAITNITASSLNSGGLYGDGPGVSNLICTGSGDAVTLDNVHRYELEGLTIKTAGTYRAIAGQRGVITTNNASICKLRDLEILGFDGGGLGLMGEVGKQQSSHTIEDIWLQGNGGFQFHSKYTNDFHYSNIQTGYLPGIAHADVGIMLENSDEGEMTFVKCWSNVQGIKEKDCRANRYIGNRVEESDQEGWYSDGSERCIYLGNTIHTNSQDGDGISDNMYFKNFANITLSSNVIRTWNALYSRYGINFDTGSDLILDANIVRGFDTVNFGPYRIGGTVSGVAGDEVMRLSLNALAAGATKYLGNGYSASEGDVYLAMFRKLCALQLTMITANPPGAAETYTHTLRKNGVDTAMSAAIVGGGYAGRVSSPAPGILFDDYDFASIKAVASAGTAGTPNFRGGLVAAYY